MLSIERTPLSTRLLNGHDTNSLFGSSRTTSIDGSARRTYLAAVAPPTPPPITTTRRPDFCAKSETVGAQPAASRPSPMPDVPRKCLRVQFIWFPLGGPRRAPQPPDARKRPGTAVAAPRIRYTALNRPVDSFQVASIAHPRAIATINTIAPPQPSDDGRKTAAPSFWRRPVCAATSRVRDAPAAKHATAAQSFTWPSPARHREPAPQPPASVIPTPKASPPASQPSPAAGNTHSLLSFRSPNFKIAKPSVDTTSASAATRVCSASPDMNGSRKARTRQKRERWKTTPNAPPKSRKTDCVP